jgi:N-acetylmuramoyl-L-alanine amidase
VAAENSVILVEDFKDTYQGFDPNKPESLIGLTILQRRI